MAATVAFLNMKGGVGKTSLCFHLAGQLAMEGYKVLLVDNDPQASLTQAFLGSTETMNLDPKTSIITAYEFAKELSTHPLQTVSTGIRGLDLVPGTIYLADWAIAESMTRVPRSALLDALTPLQGNYDHILIDCPPKIDSLSYRALFASDGLIIPVTADDLGVQGIAHVISATSMVRMNRGKPMLVGIAINKHQARTKVEQMFAEALREEFRQDVFNTALPQATTFPESLLHRKPVSYHKPSSRAGESIQAFTMEYLRRVGERVTVTTSREAV
jgi:chromosome partitioning protein